MDEIYTNFTFDTSELVHTIPIDVNTKRADIFIPSEQIYKFTWSINKREADTEPYKRFTKAFNTRITYSSFIENLCIQQVNIDIYIKQAYLSIVIDKYYIHYILEVAEEDINFIERKEITNGKNQDKTFS